MTSVPLGLLGLLCMVLVSGNAMANDRAVAETASGSAPRIYAAKGIVQELDAARKTIVIRHDAIPGYMEAMTMPFRTQAPNELSGLAPGDTISFRLLVTADESWIEHVQRTGKGAVIAAGTRSVRTNGVQTTRAQHPLRAYPFTNELGEAVSLNDFQGQALAITFFFTRCPIPDYCPRLSKNFAEASTRMAALSDAPTNWHFLSVTFDTAFDTPSVLKAYAKRYHYDPHRWSFLTGPADKVAELAGLSEVTFDQDGGGFFKHNFRTIVVDATGRLQMTFPIGGDLSDALVSEMIKAASAKKE